MDTRTGELKSIVEVQEMTENTQKFFVLTNNRELTTKQIKGGKVSIKDHISKAGRKLTTARGNMRNQPCPCGSGIKTKKCCYILK
ncbi:SEC-C domain-containing protein [Candidatus Pacearchaeota archaeon]|nr:SEC-C domain-containing protein [Candidatus Pacearchaeota archaeon]